MAARATAAPAMQAHQHLVVHCKKSKYDVYCGRQSGGAPKDCRDFAFGNPYTMRHQDEREERVESFRRGLLADAALVARVRTELPGKRLACWCSPQLCHCHVLACVANSPAQTCTQRDLEEYIQYLHLSGRSRGKTGGGGSAGRASSRAPGGGRAAPSSSSSSSAAAAPTRSTWADQSAPAARQRQQQQQQKQQQQQRRRNAQVSSTQQQQNQQPRAQLQVHGARAVPVAAAGPTQPPVEVIDIGINITSKQLKKGNWRALVGRAEAAGVPQILLTGTSVRCSRESLTIAHAWAREQGRRTLHCTVGVHPHDAASFDAGTTVAAMRALLKDDLAVAVGECGLDYNRNFSTPAQQRAAFQAQLELACELQMPVFIHEREAHADMCAILDQFKGRLPPAVVHCFTGTEAEALEYVARGLFIGFTGTICKAERGAPLRALLPCIPLDRLMLETDAPWMGFVKGRRTSEPADVVMVAAKMAEVLRLPMATVAAATTRTARSFFRLPARTGTVRAVQSQRAAGGTSRVAAPAGHTAPPRGGGGGWAAAASQASAGGGSGVTPGDAQSAVLECGRSGRSRRRNKKKHRLQHGPGAAAGS